jgi:uncharacterized repeat protein (TIGR01451 family)
VQAHVLKLLLHILILLISAVVAPTIAMTQVAGSPTLSCAASPLRHDWATATPAWTSGALSNSYSLSGLGTYSFTITSTDPLIASTPQVSTLATGGITPADPALFLRMENDTVADAATIVMTLPTAVSQMQFSLFDIDRSATFIDQITVTGSFNGATVLPTLTNGLSNSVSGNVATGTATASDTSADGTLTITFTSPVDRVTIIYGSGPGAPTNPSTQSMSIHDIIMCQPTATLSVTKISSVLSDGVSGANPKAIPGATVQYCITVQNNGSGTTANMNVTDNIPANVTYILNTIRSGSNCGTATTLEDDDATDASETDGTTASIAGTTITGKVGSLPPSGTKSLIFNARIN